MKKVHFEIHAAAGGDDAKLFVGELAKAYEHMFVRMAWKYR